MNIIFGPGLIVKQLLILEATKRPPPGTFPPFTLPGALADGPMGDPDGTRTKHIKYFSHGNEHRRRRLSVGAAIRGRREPVTGTA